MGNHWHNCHAQLPASAWMFKDYTTGMWMFTYGVLGSYEHMHTKVGVQDDWGNFVEIKP